MRLHFRDLRKGEQDVELVCGVLFIPLFALAAVLTVKFLPECMTPVCMLRTLTGIPCPTCGSYRCVALLAGGQVGQAWLTQPLATTLIALALVYAVYAWVVVGLRLPRVRVEGWTARHTWVVLGVLAVLGVLNWAWLIAAELGWVSP